MQEGFKSLGPLILKAKRKVGLSPHLRSKAAYHFPKSACYCLYRVLKLDSFQEMRIKRPIRPQGLSAEQEKKQRSRPTRTLKRDILPLNNIDGLETIEDINSTLRAIAQKSTPLVEQLVSDSFVGHGLPSAGLALKSNLSRAPQE